MKEPIQYNKNKKRVLKAFYRTELRDGEDVIDNQSPTISKELNVNVATVNHIIAMDMKRKIKELNERISVNHEPEHIEDIEVEYEEVKPLKPFANKDINKKTSNHSSKYTGVSWFKRDKIWMSRIKIKGKLKHLGNFDSEFKAHLAYEDALEELNFEKQKETNLYFSP